MEKCLSFLLQFFNSDNEIRTRAEESINQLLQHDPKSFCTNLFLILQNSTQLPPVVIQFSLLLLKRIYRRASDACRTRDDSFSYRLISLEETKNMIPLIISFFGNSSIDIQNASSYLLGQISIYFVLQPREKSNIEILLLLITNIDNNQFLLPSLNSILFQISEEPKLIMNCPTIQQQFMNKLMGWLNMEFDCEFKSKVINLITLLIPFFSNILFTPEDNTSFFSILLELTTVPNFKAASYEFWVTLCEQIPILIAPHIPNILQMAIEDIKIITPEFISSKDSQFEIILIELFQLILNLSETESEQPDLTSQIMKSQISRLLPFLFQIGELFVTIEAEEIYSVYTEICKCLKSLLNLETEFSFPFSVEYGMQAINSNELNKKIFGLFLLQEVSYNLDDTEESFKFLESCFTMCAQILSQQAPLPIIQHAIYIVYNCHYYFPTSFNYFDLIPFVVNYLTAPISDGASCLIQEIVSSLENAEQMKQIIDLLFQLNHYNSINCAYFCLKNLNEDVENEIIQSTIIESIKLCDALLKAPTPDIEYILTPLLEIISLANKTFFTEDNYTSMMQICNVIFEQFENPICLSLYCKFICISKDVELLTNVMQKILSYLDSNEYESLISSSLDSVIYFLRNGIDISPFVGDLISTLFVLIESVQLEFKLKILTILNAFLSLVPEAMQPFIPRMMALLFSSMIHIDWLEATDMIRLLHELFLAAGLFIRLIPSISNEQEEMLCDFCIQIVNSYLTADIDQHREIDLALLQTLHFLLNRNPIFVNFYLTRNTQFAQLIQPYLEQNQDEEILTLLRPLLDLTKPKES